MFAVILLPEFRLQAALRHRPELRGKAVGLVDQGDAKGVILDRTAAAERDHASLGTDGTGQIGERAMVRDLEFERGVTLPSLDTRMHGASHCGVEERGGDSAVLLCGDERGAGGPYGRRRRRQGENRAHLPVHQSRRSARRVPRRQDCPWRGR